MKAFKVEELTNCIKQAIEINSKADHKHRFMCIVDSDDPDGFESFLVDYNDVLRIRDKKNDIDTIADYIFWCDLYTGELISLAAAVKISEKVINDKKGTD